MSYSDCDEATHKAPAACEVIELVVTPRVSDIGNFEVMRALPNAKKRMVGPFIFWDQMGPGDFAPGQGLDVRPHPHIGLSTVTYLFSGSMAHKDSLGNDLVITPGEVNLMTAGKGITHSERSDPASRAAQSDLFGIQSWLALPKDQAEIDPSFLHYAADDIPKFELDGVQGAVIMGTAYGQTSPVKTYWETLYVSAEMNAGAILPVSGKTEERAIFVVGGEVELRGDVFHATQLIVLKPGDDVTITAKTDAKVMLLGGAAMDGPRYIWWNFVSHDKDRIKEAARAWEAGEFPKVADDPEFIPLPDPKPIDHLK